MTSREGVPSNWFEHIVRLANEGIWTLDVSGGTNYINQRGAAILGYLPEEMLGRPPHDFLFPEDQDAVLDSLERHGRIRRDRLEVRALRRDGSAVWIAVSFAPIYDDDSGFQGALAVFSDITDHKRVEEALAFQAHLLASVHDAIVATDGELIITYWNEMAERLFGWSAEETIGRHTREVLHPTLPRDPTEALIRRTLHDGFFDGETCCRRRDGREVVVDVHVSAVKGPGGKVREFVASLRDISERKAAEETLRRSEERYRHLVQYAPAAIFELDFRDMRFGRVNEVASELTGYSQAELLAMSPFDFLGPEDRERLRQGIEERLEGRRADQPSEYRVRTRDGQALWMIFHLKPIVENGRTVGALVVGHDDTGPRRTREALKASEERLRTVIDNSRDGIFMIDLAQDRFILISPSLIDITGLSREELCGLSAQHALDRVHPEDREVAWGYQQRMIAGVDTGEPVEYRWLVKGSEYRWLSDRRTLVRDERGRPAALVGTSRDITGRKREEIELRKSEERLTLALSAAHLGTWDWNIPTDEAAWNEHEYLMLGYRPGEVWPDLEAWSRRIHPSDQDWMRTYLTQALEQDDDLRAEFRVRWPDGTVRWIDALGGVERDPRGRAVRTFGVMMDVTDRKLSEKKLAMYAQELERSNEELQQFAYVASHDLQEPLRMVSLYMDLLDRNHGSELSPQAREYVGIAHDGAVRMQELVHDLLEYSRVETTAREFGPVDMSGVISLVKDELRVSIDEAEASVIVGELPAVLADASQMKQLLQNLISNAIKFRRDSKPAVRVWAQDRGSEHLFAVEDNGIGIDPKYQDNLFKMFSRLHSREEYDGTGIGLAIARKIVERHGGRIWVESDGENGSTFFFTLPKRGSE